MIGDRKRVRAPRGLHRDRPPPRAGPGVSSSWSFGL